MRVGEKGSRLVSSIGGNSGCGGEDKVRCAFSVPLLHLPWEPGGRS